MNISGRWKLLAKPLDLRSYSVMSQPRLSASPPGPIRLLAYCMWRRPSRPARIEGCCGLMPARYPVTSRSRYTHEHRSVIFVTPRLSNLRPSSQHVTVKSRKEENKNEPRRPPKGGERVSGRDERC